MKPVIKQSIVIIANTFNPNIFTQSWLIEQGVISEDDTIPHQVLQPAMAQLFTSELQLSVTPNRMQIVFTGESKDNPKTLIDGIKNIIIAIEYTPYTAIGANFDYTVTSKKLARTINTTISKSDFAKNVSTNKPNTKYGIFMSEPVCILSDPILNLDVKPAQDKNTMRCVFNFNRGLTDNDKENVMMRFLDEFETMKTYAKLILDNIR